MHLRERLATAFPDDDFTIASPDDVPEEVTDTSTAELLTTVGFPEHIVSLFFFEDLDEGLETLGEFRNSPTLPDSLSMCYLIGVSDLHSTCLDGTTGKCFFVPKLEEVSFEAASTLQNFLEFTAALNEAILEVHPESSAEALDQLENNLVASMRERDPEALQSSEHEWRKMIRRCFGFVL
ncbi:MULTISPECIES: SUKH-4 family immunity protein [unclassified Streptomyces]|uniref:SUKH-4 family immunity protein n=1 Tax=unclassified Streptomyces TaxID=2593676 RepID=UPI00136EB8F3|nr:SUKH-4 family immunity protein [Streptomyces sp. SID2563]MYW11010.1 hypothetical protein [Streptomyces sp. SID2563]